MSIWVSLFTDSVSIQKHVWRGALRSSQSTYNEPGFDQSMGWIYIVVLVYDKSGSIYKTLSKNITNELVAIMHATKVYL